MTITTRIKNALSALRDNLSIGVSRTPDQAGGDFANGPGTRSLGSAFTPAEPHIHNIPFLRSCQDDDTQHNSSVPGSSSDMWDDHSAHGSFCQAISSVHAEALDATATQGSSSFGFVQTAACPVAPNSDSSPSDNLNGFPLQG